MKLIETGEQVTNALAISLKRRLLFWAQAGHGIRKTSLDTFGTTNVYLNSTEDFYVGSMAVRTAVFHHPLSPFSPFAPSAPLIPPLTHNYRWTRFWTGCTGQIL